VEGFAEHQVSRDIGGEVGPPFEYICCSGDGVCFDTSNSQINFLANNIFPLLTQVTLAEAFGQQFSSRSMFFGIGHVEDTRAFANAIGVEIFIPVGFVEARADLVNIFETGWVVDGDLVWCDAYNRTVFLVEFVDVVGAATTEDCYFQAPVY